MTRDGGRRDRIEDDPVRGTDPHGRGSGHRRARHDAADPYDAQTGPGLNPAGGTAPHPYGPPDPYGPPGRYGSPGSNGPPTPSALPEWQGRPAAYGRPDLYDPPGTNGRAEAQPQNGSYGAQGANPGLPVPRDENQRDLPGRYRDQGPPGQPGPSGPYSQPGARDPYSQPGARDRYGDPGLSGRYSQPGVRDPLSQSGPRDPLSQPGVRDPYSQPGVPDPYSQPRAGDRYSQPGMQDPYSQPGVRDPYSQPGARDPLSQPGASGPYSQPGVPDRYSQPGLSGPHSQPGIRDPFSQPGVRDPLSQPGVRDPFSQPGVRDPLSQPGGGDRHSQPGLPDTSRPGGWGQPGGYGRSGEFGQPQGYGRAAGGPPPDRSRPQGDYRDPGLGQGGPATGPFRWRPPPGTTGPQQPGRVAQPGVTGPQPPIAGRPPAGPGAGWGRGSGTGYRQSGLEPDTGTGRGAVGRQGGRGSRAGGPGAPDGPGWHGDQAGPRPQGGPPWQDARRVADPADSADHGTFIPGFEGAAGRRRDQGKRPRKRRLSRVLAPLLAIVLLVVLVAGGIYEWRKLRSPDYSGPGTGQVTVQVLPGDSATSLAPRLVRLGVVASTNAFISAAKKSRNSAGLEPGYFRLRKHMNAALAYALLLNPKSRLQTSVTIPDGLRLTQILSTLAAKTQFPLSAYQQAAKDTKALGLPSYAHGNLEGYLYPATYTIQHGTSAQGILQAMLARYKQEATSLNLPVVAAQKQLTPGEVITVASLLEAEGGNPSYYAKIARVIYNRLNDNMKLQLDSTVLYALHRFGFKLTTAQLQVKSPYNTFLHLDLPPGPIDSPGEAAIKAALNPAHGDWLYFVTVNPKTGLTKFTSSPTVFEQYQAECRANGAC
jgi:peptidoglycan lytic transglycosylase G